MVLIVPDNHNTDQDHLLCDCLVMLYVNKGCFNSRETVLLDQTLLQFSKEDQQGLSQMAETYKSTKASDRHAALLTFFSESARAKIPALWLVI